ncbi:MAG: DUF2207 domain-containing protein [Tetrasphaera sp.]
MTSAQLGEIVAAALLPLLIVLVTVVWFRRRRRDEVFDGVTPGELPALGQQTTRRRVGGGRSEWSGPIAVRFTPPDGMTPGLMGTVVDGSADVVDVSATLVDLAVRGYLHLHAEPLDPEARPPPQRGPERTQPAAPQKHEWRLTRIRHEPDGALLAFERALLDKVFADGEVVTIGELKRRGFDLTMREAQVGLYREVVDRGYYTKHPRDRNRRLGCLGVPLALVGLILAAGAWAAMERYQIERFPGLLLTALGAGLLVAALILLWGGRGRTPRTAEGSAVRIQALGFKEYLTKAEANQIRFEEARDLFSRYLPYAMVFGVAHRWAQTFGEVARAAHAQGLGAAYVDLTWVDGLDLATDLLFYGPDLVSGIGDLAAGVGDLADGLDIADALDGVADGVGDFASSASGLLDFGDGCGGCDGCDAPGCDI